VICEQAVLRYAVGGSVEIRWNDGRVEKSPLEPFDALEENHVEYIRYLRGEVPRPATTLADSRPFVTLNDLAYVSSGRITPIPVAHIGGVRDEKEQKDYLQVAGMTSACEAFLERGVWPGGNGWNREPGEIATPADLPRFHETIHKMAR
jgi:hypothetical protein